MGKLAVLLVVLTFLACASMPPETRDDGRRAVTIYVVSHGWHTGIAIPVHELPADTWPERRDFPNAVFLEVGWGDRGYYRASDPGTSTALRAALIGGPGVLHLVALPKPPPAVFTQSEVVAVAVSRQGLKRLGAHISASYERNQHGETIPLGPGLYGNSRFYASREHFHLFNTCNVWTARALRAAGVPVSPSLTAEGLMEEVRRAVTQLQQNR